MRMNYCKRHFTEKSEVGRLREPKDLLIQCSDNSVNSMNVKCTACSVDQLETDTGMTRYVLPNAMDQRKDFLEQKKNY